MRLVEVPEVRVGLPGMDCEGEGVGRLDEDEGRDGERLEAVRQDRGQARDLVEEVLGPAVPADYQVLAGRVVVPAAGMLDSSGVEVGVEEMRKGGGKWR